MRADAGELKESLNANEIPAFETKRRSIRRLQKKSPKRKATAAREAHEWIV